MKVSEHKRRKMRTMCGLPPGREASPQWFKDIHEQHVNDANKCSIIAKHIRTTFIYEDAEVLLYADLR